MTAGEQNRCETASERRRRIEDLMRRIRESDARIEEVLISSSELIGRLRAMQEMRQRRRFPF